MILRALSMLGSIPHSLIIKAATYGLVFWVGLGFGQYWATERELVREQERGAQREAAVGKAVFTAFKESNAKAEQRRSVERSAEKASYNLLADAMAEAMKDLEATEEKLETEVTKTANLKGQTDGLLKVQGILVDDMSKPAPR